MIGPAARRHAMQALQAAGEAEYKIRPGAMMSDAMLPLMRAQVSIIRAQAFALLQEGDPDGKQGDQQIDG